MYLNQLLDKSVPIPLGLTAAALVADAGIHKKFLDPECTIPELFFCSNNIEKLK